MFGGLPHLETQWVCRWYLNNCERNGWDLGRWQVSAKMCVRVDRVCVHTLGRWQVQLTYLLNGHLDGGHLLSCVGHHLQPLASLSSPGSSGAGTGPDPSQFWVPLTASAMKILCSQSPRASRVAQW